MTWIALECAQQRVHHCEYGLPVLQAIPDTGSKPLFRLAFSKPRFYNDGGYPVPKSIIQQNNCMFRPVLIQCECCGSARHSHCRGQGFDSPMLHHLRTLILIRYRRPFFCPKMPRNKGFPAIRLFQTEVPVAGFFFSSPVASRVFLHDYPKNRVNLHD